MLDNSSSPMNRSIPDFLTSPVCLTKINESNGRYVTELLPTDVLFGRGSGPNEHYGNIRFRTFVNERKAEYNSTSHRMTKTKIAKEIVEKVKSNPESGRFVRKLEPLEAYNLGLINIDPRIDESIGSPSSPAAITAAAVANAAIIYEVVDEAAAIDKAKQTLRQNKQGDYGLRLHIEDSSNHVQASSKSHNETSTNAAASPALSGNSPLLQDFRSSSSSSSSNINSANEDDKLFDPNLFTETLFISNKILDFSQEGAEGLAERFAERKFETFTKNPDSSGSIFPPVVCVSQKVMLDKTDENGGDNTTSHEDGDDYFEDYNHYYSQNQEQRRSSGRMSCDSARMKRLFMKQQDAFSSNSLINKNSSELSCSEQPPPLAVRMSSTSQQSHFASMTMNDLLLNRPKRRCQSTYGNTTNESISGMESVDPLIDSFRTMSTDGMLSCSSGVFFRPSIGQSTSNNDHFRIMNAQQFLQQQQQQQRFLNSSVASVDTMGTIDVQALGSLADNMSYATMSSTNFSPNDSSMFFNTNFITPQIQKLGTLDDKKDSTTISDDEATGMINQICTELEQENL